MFSFPRFRSCPVPVGAALLLSVLGGCASGESIGEPDEFEAADLGERVDPIVGEVFVDVVDPDGMPVEADAVWLTVDGARRNSAHCMQSESPECETWFAGYEAMQRVTVWADVCGILFLDAVTLGTGSDVQANHVTLVANDVACGGAERSPAHP